MRTTKQAERWQEFRLSADERPKVMYEYHVTGWGEFPYDMLRHDSCWPATGADAAKLDAQDWARGEMEAGHRKMRSVKMRSYRAPTVDRWHSFCWSVGDAAVVK